jgi:hypothetical protein
MNRAIQAGYSRTEMIFVNQKVLFRYEISPPQNTVEGMVRFIASPDRILLKISANPG